MRYRTAGLHEGLHARPWLLDVVVTPPAAAVSVPPAAGEGAPAAAASQSHGHDMALPRRMRPLIYVYDIPPTYTSRMLQYKMGTQCGYRHFIARRNLTEVIRMVRSGRRGGGAERQESATHSNKHTHEAAAACSSMQQHAA